MCVVNEDGVRELREGLGRLQFFVLSYTKRKITIPYMNKVFSIFLIYLGSVCYTVASFYHLSFTSSQWSFGRAYAIALFFVAIEYVFNVIGNRSANRYLSVFQIMILIIAFDLINLYILNALLLKNKLEPLRDGLALLLVMAAVLLSSKTMYSK